MKLRNLESLLSSSPLPVVVLYTTMVGGYSVALAAAEAMYSVVQSAVADEPFANTVAVTDSGTARALADAHQAAAASNIDTAHDTMVVISYVVPETEVRRRVYVLQTNLAKTKSIINVDANGRNK